MEGAPSPSRNIFSFLADFSSNEKEIFVGLVVFLQCLFTLSSVSRRDRRRSVGPSLGFAPTPLCLPHLSFFSIIFIMFAGSSTVQIHLPALPWCHANQNLTAARPSPQWSPIITPELCQTRYNTNQHKKVRILRSNQSEAVPIMLGLKLQHPRRIQPAVLPQFHLG
ncbi:hypothetical protein B0H65DRAFT_326933 [Neurospora tetraspora]|uniref:Uncharacterized protein n=1 Tax=Neurospora tetraspora TaxID=94610 RepID=A0AAE0J7U2_9PEZI|nr:hypothetical protein B0H65DRAFT_326933 [Neurospora tetraspora]